MMMSFFVLFFKFPARLSGPSSFFHAEFDNITHYKKKPTLPPNKVYFINKHLPENHPFTNDLKISRWSIYKLINP